MRAVIQRVAPAAVDVAGETVAAIDTGLLVYLGVQQDDTDRDLAYIADKIANLRIFEDAAGKMNLNVQQAAGQILVVPAFTLLADARKGRRPTFDQAAHPQLAERLYLALVDRLKTMDIDVQTGQFQATMQVTATNTGPVLTLLDSRRLF